MSRVSNETDLHLKKKYIYIMRYYGVATIRRLLKIIGLLYRISSL